MIVGAASCVLNVKDEIANRGVKRSIKVCSRLNQHTSARASAWSRFCISESARALVDLVSARGFISTQRRAERRSDKRHNAVSLCQPSRLS
jgi:hypothetical protein